MSHAAQLTAYLEAIADLYPKLTEEEQQAFVEWRSLPTSKRNSDWPGWVKYLGPRPGAPVLLEIRRSA